jgi:hypothetical protein
MEMLLQETMVTAGQALWGWMLTGAIGAALTLTFCWAAAATVQTTRRTNHPAMPVQDDTRRR